MESIIIPYSILNYEEKRLKLWRSNQFEHMVAILPPFSVCCRPKSELPFYFSVYTLQFCMSNCFFLSFFHSYFTGPNMSIFNFNVQIYLSTTMTKMLVTRNHSRNVTNYIYIKANKKSNTCACVCVCNCVHSSKNSTPNWNIRPKTQIYTYIFFFIYTTQPIQARNIVVFLCFSFVRLTYETST